MVQCPVGDGRDGPVSAKLLEPALFVHWNSPGIAVWSFRKLFDDHRRATALDATGVRRCRQIDRPRLHGRICTTAGRETGRRRDGGRSEGEAPWRTAPRVTPSRALLRPAACLAPAPFGVLLVGLRPVRAALPPGLLQGHVWAEWSASDQAGGRPAVGGAS